MPFHLEEVINPPYNLSISGITANTRVQTEDSDIIFYCEEDNRTVIRTITIYNDANSNTMFDAGEEIGFCTYQISTIPDNTAPTFIAPPDATTTCILGYDPNETGDVTFLSDNDCPVLNSSDFVFFADATAEGNCSGEIIITRSWVAVDPCGNTAQPQTQMITVECPPDCFNQDICVGDIVTDPQPGECDCDIVVVQVLGCTNSDACNYDPDANCNDESCIIVSPCNNDPCAGDITTLSVSGCFAS